MKQYRNRIYDTVLRHRLEAKGAVLVEGPKWCGKTTTCLQLAQSVLYMAQPDIREQNIMLADMQPSLLLQGATPRLIDEWQIAPKLWDAVRLEVDQRDEFNQFLLTGSSVPPSFTDITHTGTGRIARLRMRPMSLYESGDSTGAVSFASLFEGESMPLSRVDSNIEHIAFLLCRGGWPKAIDRTERIALQQSRDYLDAIVESDISEWTMCNEILTWHVVYCVRMLVWNPHSRNHHKLPRTCEAVPKVPATKPCNPTYPHWKKYSFLRICLRGIQICAPRVQYALQIPDILSIPPSQRQH